MTDLRTAAEPKTDQLNADSLMGGKTLTIKVTGVTVALTGEQRVVIHYEGESGRPYKPCKSMIRVLIQVWGADGNQYVGRSMTLYADEKVQFGGLAVGGIRISHMSHIDRDATVMLTVTRANKKPFTVKRFVEIVDNMMAQIHDVPKITREQQTAIAEAAKKAGITGASVFERFSVGRLSAIPVSQFAEVTEWIAAQKSTDDLCPECLTEGGHSASCPRAEPPEGE